MKASLFVSSIEFKDSNLGKGSGKREFSRGGNY
jgi:hypothetical protein